MYYRWLWLSQFFFCMIGCCFSLIEQDVSVLFCQAVSVVGRGCSPKPAVDVLSLFPHFFVLDSMEWERTIYFAVLFPHCSSDVCFLCFVVCFGHHVILYFVCRCMRPAERRSSLSGWIFLSSVSAILVFSFFVWKYFISVFLFSSCLSLFSLFFLSSCFVNMLGWLLSFFQIFSCLLYSIFVYSFFFLNIISLYKHWCLNFICFLIIVYKDKKKYLFAYV